MKFLLDTRVCLWLVKEPAKVSRKAMRVLKEPRNGLRVLVATARSLKLTLATADENIIESKAVSILAAR